MTSFEVYPGIKLREIKISKDYMERILYSKI